MRGRPKNMYGGITVEQWLKSYLSGGSRSALEIKEVSSLRGFGWRSVETAKSELGIDSKRVGHAWHWRDREIPDAKPKSDDKHDILIHEIRELKRQGEKPTAISVDGPVKIDLTEVDEDGFLTSSPKALGLLDIFDQPSVSVTDIHQRLRAEIKSGRDHAEVVRDFFEWAYPNSGYSESMLKTFLRSNRISIPSRLSVVRPGSIVF
jgi:hypothetical protein